MTLRLLHTGSFHDLELDLQSLADDGLEIIDAEDAEEPAVVAGTRDDGRIGRLLDAGIS